VTKPKTTDQLLNDVARVFYDQTRARWNYGLEEAMETVESYKNIPEGFYECFGGALRGGMYRHELAQSVNDSFKHAQNVLNVLRKEPDAALELLTEPPETEGIL
jgi:hypothetical protein